MYDPEQRRSYLQAAAERHLIEGLKLMGVDEEELGKLPKGDERKLLLAGWIKTNFLVSSAWLSQRLCMGHRSRMSQAPKFYNNPPPELRRQKAKLAQMLTLSG